MKRTAYLIALVWLCVVPMFWTKVQAAPDASQKAPHENPFAFQDSSIPDSAPMTRAQAAALFARTLNAREQEDLQQFSDIPSQAWYRDAMAQATAAGLFEGYQGRLRPEDPLTRQEARLVLSRLLSLDANEAILGDLAQNRPRETLSRGEFLRLANSLLPQSLEPGAQDWELEGSVLLSSPGDYNRLVVEGDLVLAEGAGNGETCIRDALISGRILIRGGGSVKLEGRVQAQQIEIAPSSSRLRLDCQTEQPLVLENYGNMPYCDGNYSTISLCRPGGQVLLAGDADAVSLLAKNSCFQALPGCQVAFADIRGDGSTLLGQGLVKQAAVSAANVQIDTPDTAVLSLPGSGPVWVNGALAQPGLTQTAASAVDKKPEKPASSSSSFFPSTPSAPTEPSSPESPVRPPERDSVALDLSRSDPALQGLESQQTEDSLLIRLQGQPLLQGGFPAGLEEFFQQRDPGQSFAVATLIFQPPEALDLAETVTLSYSSHTLLLMGYGPEDSEDSIVYNIENGLLTVEQRLPAAELAEGLPLILPFTAQPEQISISLQWGANQQPQKYVLKLDGVSFQPPPSPPLPPSPELLLSQPEIHLISSESGPALQIHYQRSIPVSQSLISIGLEGEQPLAVLEPEDLQAEQIQLLYPLDLKNRLIPLDANWNVTVEETVQQQTQSLQWQGSFSAEQWANALPEEQNSPYVVDSAYIDPESPEEYDLQDQLDAMWQEGDEPFAGLLRFDETRNLLLADIGKADGLSDWLQDNFQQDKLPVMVASEPFLPGVELIEAWGETPILWLEAENFSSPGLFCLTADGLPPFYLLFCDDLDSLF
ncbi:MAG: S-layer homology domain-containing protein [Clostridiaceae bacterium]|jgi:hypothetical protein|nr:S-layer homology domain-containing protein [Clostridiaceae bacterium]